MKRLLLGIVIFTLAAPIAPVFSQIRRPAAVRSSVAAKRAVQPEIRATAVSEGSGVLVSWTLTADMAAAGFDVSRDNGRSIVRINANIIPGPAMQNGVADSAGAAYRIFDPAGAIGNVYTVEARMMAGETIKGSPAAAVYNYDLRSVAGRYASRGMRAATNAPSPSMDSQALSLPADLQAEVNSARLRPGTKMQGRLASIAGVKIGIKTSGLYRVTAAQLQTAGFDTASDPSRWQLFVDGNEQAIGIGPGGSFIEFYATAIDTVECNTRMYYLTAGGQYGKRFEPRSLRPVGGMYQTPHYNQTYRSVERNTYVNTILNGDAENWWGRLVSTPSTDYSFTVTGVDASVASVPISVALYGFTFVPHSVTISLNGHTLGVATGTNQAPVVFNGSIPASYLAEGTNTLTMTSQSASDVSLFDGVTIDFPRRYVAASDKINFYTDNYRRATVEGFSSANIRLLDVTNPNEPAEYSNLRVVADASNFDLMLPAARGRVFYAFTDGAALAPYSVTPNYASSLKTPNHSAEMLIIYYRDYASQAAQWAAYRRSQGTTVELVDADDIYDEFSFGIKNWEAINAFFQYAKSTWAGAPQYALIIGGASENPKDYDLSPDDQGYNNDVPTRIVNTIYTETGSDEAMGDFDNDGLSDIAIGRIPGRTTDDVQAALDKTIQWEAGLADLGRGNLFAYDLPDGYDFQAMSGRIAATLPNGTPVTSVGRGDTGSHNAVMAAINSGKYMVNYTGHGTIGIWASSEFFGNPYVSQLANTDSPSTFTMLTCLNGYFLNAYGYSLAENLLETPRIGAAAVWASTGKTTPDVQEIMAARFYQQVGEGRIIRLGDLVMDAKQQLPTAHDVRVSWILMGDPMLKMH